MEARRGVADKTLRLLRAGTDKTPSSLRDTRPPMAGALIADPSFFSPLLPLPSARRSFSLPERNLRLYRKPSLLPAASPCVTRCSCAAGTLDPEPSEEIANPSLSTRIEGGKDRRRAVRIAWEKLVRWSRSWRSKAKTDDVLERTKKVFSIWICSFLLQKEDDSDRYFCFLNFLPCFFLD